MVPVAPGAVVVLAVGVEVVEEPKRLPAAEGLEAAVPLYNGVRRSARRIRGDEGNKLS